MNSGKSPRGSYEAEKDSEVEENVVRYEWETRLVPSEEGQGTPTISFLKKCPTLISWVLEKKSIHFYRYICNSFSIYKGVPHGWKPPYVYQLNPTRIDTLQNPEVFIWL